ncbi:hypothetical protein [Nonomuraea indica]|uniref:hypothetical protein n=1 Tax=Nonomuraea indica TaxID=1581193 RepID=UPI000C79A29B|nr:hypothetical protein [Nonomuraea indica]
MRLPLALLALVLVTGCSVDTSAPARTVERFHSALAAQQDEAACALLAPRTAEKLPDPGQTCAEALRALRLGAGGPVTGVQVWGDEAQVRLAGDTVFLHRFSDGWRVKAAGCEPRAGLPYDCEVED